MDRPKQWAIEDLAKYIMTPEALAEFVIQTSKRYSHITQLREEAAKYRSQRNAARAEAEQLRAEVAALKARR